MGDVFIFLSSLRKGKLGVPSICPPPVFQSTYYMEGNLGHPVPDPVRRTPSTSATDAPPPQLADVQHQRAESSSTPPPPSERSVTGPKGLAGARGRVSGAEAGWVKSRQVTTGCARPRAPDGEC